MKVSTYTQIQKQLKVEIDTGKVSGGREASQVYDNVDFKKSHNR